MKAEIHNLLEIPNYGMIEAARFFHIPQSTVSYWAHEERLVNLAAPRALSFKNMVEFYVIKGLREIYDVSPTQIRKALRHLRDRSQHPFADFDIVTDGKYVLFYDEGRKLENASMYGQFEMELVIKTYLRRVDRSSKGIAERIYPYTKLEQLGAKIDPPRLIVMDPAIRSGLPVLNGSRLTTAILASRYKGGDHIPALANSYGRPLAEIQEAVEWEIGQRVTIQ